jgi:uncharacterized membrane protein
MIMDKELVIVVPTEAGAYQAMKALSALDESGAIELYSAVVVTKTANGNVTVKDKSHLREPWGTVLGMTTGALVGLLAGPVGVAVGAAVGGAAGLGGDLAYSGFVGEFVRDVAGRLNPGGFAVCASVWEDWTVPVDLEMTPLGAVVYRQATEEVVAAQIRSDWQDVKDQEAHLEAEIARATGEAKAKLEARRAELRAKGAARRERLQKRERSLEQSWEAKIASVRAKAANAKAEAKARHEQHAEKLARFEAAQKAAFRDLFA